MMKTPSSGDHLVDVVLWIWFALTALCVAYVAYDQFKGGPAQKENSLAMKTMRWGWVLVTLYTGPFGFIVYWFLHRESAQGSPDQSAPPLWEQSVESTIHCAGSIVGSGRYGVKNGGSRGTPGRARVRQPCEGLAHFWRTNQENERRAGSVVVAQHAIVTQSERQRRVHGGMETVTAGLEAANTERH